MDRLFKVGDPVVTYEEEKGETFHYTQHGSCGIVIDARDEKQPQVKFWKLTGHPVEEGRQHIWAIPEKDLRHLDVDTLSDEDKLLFVRWKMQLATGSIEDV